MNILMTLANPFTHDPRVYYEARSLVKAGHKVTVFGWDRKNENIPTEVIDGIFVVRSFNTKIMNLVIYDVFKMQLWWNKGYKDVLNLNKDEPYDVVHCHDLSSLPIGIKLKKEIGIPIIYDAHEIFAYMIGMKLQKFFVKIALSTEKKLVKNVNHIITVNKPLEEYFKSISSKPITIVFNAKPLQEKKYNPPKNEKFTLLYLGSLNKNRFLLELVDVVNELPDVNCIIGGKGKKEYVNVLEKKCSKTRNVEFIGLIPMEKVLPTTKKADVIFCMTSPYSVNGSRASANKQFEAMVCGRPIICTKGTYPGLITEQERIGLTAAFTKKDLKKMIIKLRDNPKLCEDLGRNALKAAIREYNWEKQEEKLTKVYEQIVK